MSPFQCLTNEEIRALFLQLAEQRLAKFSGGFQEFKSAVVRDHILERTIFVRSDSLATTLLPDVRQRRLIEVIDSWAEEHLHPVEALVPQLPCVSVEQQRTVLPRPIVEQSLHRAPENDNHFRLHTAWQQALFDAWPEMKKRYGGDGPTAKEAIRFLKKHDESGNIMQKGGDSELWWRTQRGDPKAVALKTVQNVISRWRKLHWLPA